MYQIQNDYLKVTVDPYGAQLMSILAADGTEYLWQGDKKYWEDRSPNLFPTVSRLVGGKYQLDGNWYEMGLHGFAWHSMFTLTKEQPQALELQLRESPRTLAHYPRKFTFTVGYRLQENTLHVLYRVENRDDKEMPFGLGGHPGFNVPLAPGKRFEEYSLCFSQPCQPQVLLVSPKGYFSGETAPFPLEQEQRLPLRHDLFDDDGVFLKNAARQVTLQAQGERHSVTVSYPGMAYVGFWHAPHTDAPYVCVEPWCSLGSTQEAPAVFEYKQDLLRLEPGQIYENHWSIRCDF